MLNYRMKMGGATARTKHGAVVGASGHSGGAGLQFGELGFRDRATNCIVEDDEALDDEATSFAVTGTSGFFRKGNKQKGIIPYNQKYWRELNLVESQIANFKFGGSVQDRHTYMYI